MAEHQVDAAGAVGFDAGGTRVQVVETPCKVNLHLGIHSEKDQRGYHRVDSVMAPVALFDTVVVEDAPSLEVVHEPALEVAPERTTVYKAATLLAQELGVEPRVRVRVTARIPEKAGLGGSSADAGAALRALACRWGTDALDPRVVAVARRVGADVAFFLDPVPSLCVGAGDVLERTFAPFEAPLALVMPAAGGVSTKEAYDEFDRAGEKPRGFGAACAALEAGSVEAMAAALYNNLAPAAEALCAEVGRVRAWLVEQPGVLAAQVTGSGACSFALCRSAADADRIAAAAHDLFGWRSWSTKTVGTAPEVC